MMQGEGLNLRLVRNLFVLDVQEDARHLIADPLYLQVYWNGFGCKRYNSEKVAFSFEQKKVLLSCETYRNFPVPRFIKVVVELFGEKFFEDAYMASRFKDSGFDIFLVDYVLYLTIEMFEESSLPQDFTNWALSSDEVVDGFGVPLPRLAIACYAANEAVHSQFDLSLPAGRLGLLGWMLRWKMGLFGGCHIPFYLAEWLSFPAITTIYGHVAALTRLHEAFYWEMPANERFPSLDNRIGALSFSGWMLLNGPSVPGFDIPAWVCNVLNEFESTSVGSKTTRMMHAIWHAKHGVVSFPADGTPELDRFLTDYRSYLTELRPCWSDSDLLEGAYVPFIARSRGVNLIGWPRTEIGIGEDVRCASFALKSADFPFVVIDAATRVPPRPRPVEGIVSQWISNEYQYDVDIVFLDAATQRRYYAFELLNKVSVGRQVIGVCPWELPSWPADLSFVFDHVDRFWAATQFIKEAFQPFFPDRIDIARPAVVLPEKCYRSPDISGRGPFKFITIFDGLSSIHRKNPFATVQAFKLAFPKANDVRLIVKMMNLPAYSAEAMQLSTCIANDPRIEIVTDTLPQVELWDLVSSCHAFISLHRSEGFGRNIAEAMLLGRPVICSAFSGNLDFCKPENSYLVSGNSVQVPLGHYLNAHGQYWFDASVEHAGECMLSVYDDYTAALQRSNAARAFVLNHHSYEAVGRQYVRLMENLFINVK